MSIIDTIEELKGHYSSVSITLDTAGIRSFIDDAVSLHLVPAIGVEQYQELASRSFAPGSTQQIAFSLLQRAAAGFCLYYYANSGSLQINSAGISVVKGNNTLPASDAKLAALKKQCSADGYLFLETALICMEAYRDSFPLYHRSTERVDNTCLLLNNSKDFKQAGINISPKLYQAIRTMQRDVEADTIETLLGADLLAALRQSSLNRNLSSTQQKLAQKAAQIIAGLTMAEAIPYFPMSVNAQGAFDLKDDDAMDGSSIQRANRLAMAMIRMRESAESRLDSLRKWLAKHSSEIPLYMLPAPININDKCNSIYFL